MRSKVEIDRLQHLVVNLLSVETVSNSRDVHCEWVLLEPRARFAFETLNKVATDKAISVGIQIEDDFKVYANPPQLDQVLLNLLENAIKFTPTNGRVTIKSGDKISSFSVSDTGIGMSETEIPKIFQRFYRIDRAQSRGSTGLGLSIVKHIAELHGAKIHVSSKEGAGSSFLLEFPEPRNQAGGNKRSR